MTARFHFPRVCALLAPVIAVAAMHPVKLGLVAPAGEPDAASLRRGVQLAVEEANGAGEAPVALELRAGEGQWGTVGNDAVALVCEEKVDGLVAPSDGAATHLILQVAGRTRVPVATMCPDSSVTEAGVPWAVRVVPRTEDEAAALLASVHSSDRKPIRWWAIVPAGRPGRAVRRDLAAGARRAAGELERFVEDDGLPTGVAALARAAREAAPDGVLLWLAPARAGAAAAAFRAAGYRGQLAGPSWLDSPDFLAAAGAAAGEVRVAGIRASSELRAPADPFGSSYRLRYGSQPDSVAAAAYDAARVLIGTLRRADEGEGFRQFPLNATTIGATGLIKFDQAGNRTGELQVLTCKDGRFVPIPPTGNSS